MALRQQQTRYYKAEDEEDQNATCHKKNNFHGRCPLLRRGSRIFAYFARDSMPCRAISNSREGIKRNISFISSASSTVFCSLIRTPADVKVKPTLLPSCLSRQRAMYPSRVNRVAAMLIVDRPTPMCSANFDRLVGRVACKWFRTLACRSVITFPSSFSRKC